MILYDYQLTSNAKRFANECFFLERFICFRISSLERLKNQEARHLTNRSEAEAGLSETFKIPISLNFLPVWISTGGILSDFPSAAALACPDPQIHEHARFHRRCMQIYKERFPNTWKCKKHLPTSKIISLLHKLKIVDSGVSSQRASQTARRRGRGHLCV